MRRGLAVRTVTVRTVAVLTVLTVAVLGLVACSTTPPRVTLYGDSLGFESQGELAAQLRGDARVTPVAQGGAALCDALDQIRHDLDTRKPNVAILQFSGNNFTACMQGPDGEPLRGDALVAKYASDAAMAVSMLRERDVPVLLVGSPIGADSDNAADVNATYEALAAQWSANGGGVTYVDAGAAVLTPTGGYAQRLPCLDTEVGTEGCENGQILVRAPDGIHFCPTQSGGTQKCPVYSSGAHRFAMVIAGAVRDQLDVSADAAVGPAPPARST
jgi:hypothetical protein